MNKSQLGFHKKFKQVFKIISTTNTATNNYNTYYFTLVIIYSFHSISQKVFRIT